MREPASAPADFDLSPESYLAAQLQAAAVAALGLAADRMPAIELETPRQKDHGDLATSVALVLGKAIRRSPREVAELIVQKLEVDPRLVARVEIAGPGFINFHLGRPWVADQIRHILAHESTYGTSTVGAGTRVQVEFVSANPTGPLNVVSARAAAVGDALVALLKAAGFAAASEFYVNDAGNQVRLFAESLDVRLRELAGESGVAIPAVASGLPAEEANEEREHAIPDEGYHGEYVRELARELANDPALPDASSPARRAFLERVGIERMVAGQRRDLERFGVVFDHWFRESTLHAEGALERALASLSAAGRVHERDGARWFETTAYGDDADRVILRSDGTPTYFLADIAYHADKHARGFARVIDLWGPDHHGHVPRMQAAAQALGYGPDWLEVLIVQQVNLLRGGQPVKMSKRAGEFVTLGELVDEVGKDPARFFFLMRRTNSHLDFDLELAKQQTEENPCFYVQYAHARVAQILANAERQGVRLRAATEVPAELLTDPEEQALAKLLAGFPAAVAGAALAREPQRVTNYLREVAGLFHRFYHQHRVVGVEDELMQARLGLARATQIVIRRGLELIGVSAPERM
jgi:arginyl-tRNA synthetase